MTDVQPASRFAETSAKTARHFGMIAAGAAVAVFVIAPRAAPFLLLIMAMPALIVSMPHGITWANPRSPPLIAALMLAAYLLANSLWAQEPAEALGKTLLYIAIVAALWLARRGLGRLPDDALDPLVRTAVIAFCLALAYLMLEEVTVHAIKRALFNWLPFTRPSAKHVQLDGADVVNIHSYVSNHSMAALVLSLWPLLLMMTVAIAPARGGAPRWLNNALVLAVAALAIGTSQHETSAIALVLSLSAAAVAHWFGRIACALIAVAWIISTLLVVPIVDQAYTTQKLHMAQWLPVTARQRIIIWGYTTEQITKAPLLGIGIGSGKVLDAKHKPETPPGYVYPRRAGTHSHNVYLQTWYELGALGAALLCALGLAILLAISRLEARVRSCALATFVAAASIAAFSWGMWQPWFMAAFGVSTMLLLIAAELSRRRQHAGDTSALGA